MTEFREDIQILRGIAVLLVVLYHLNISSLFPGGFLGVDIFFVISGYLMNNACNTGSPGNFYKRRALRLLPAYLATIAVTLLVGLFLILPHELQRVSQHALFSIFLAPNIGYWLDIPYFATHQFRPLLHLWSLGIEFQFYLIVPLLAIISYKIKKLAYGVFALSFFACFLIHQTFESTAFFQLPFRLWEFGIGFVVADYLRSNSTATQQHSNTASLVGLQ